MQKKKQAGGERSAPTHPPERDIPPHPSSRSASLSAYATPTAATSFSEPAAALSASAPWNPFGDDELPLSPRLLPLHEHLQVSVPLIGPYYSLKTASIDP